MTALPPLEFGTDGLRGRAGQPPMDPASLRGVGAALGVVLQRSGRDQKRVLLGNDGRDSAGWILEVLAQGLSAAEVACNDLGLCTTPALARLVRSEHFEAGVMISASHNPATDNGIKIFASSGEKLEPTDEAELARLAVALAPEQLRTPRIRGRSELLRRYEEQLAAAFPELDLTGQTVCLDAANGGGSELAGRVLRGFGAEVVEVACNPDGTNINDGCGALHPEALAAAVREHGARLGIALDGDGDRGIFVDEAGTVRDGDDVLALFGRSLHRAGRLPHQTVAATVMSNLGLHRALGSLGVAVHTTAVGDRNVFVAMRERGLALGGEQSGHVLFADHDLVGDGLYTGLRILAELRGGSAAAAFAGLHRYPQALQSVPVRDKPDLAGIPTVAAAIAAAERELAGDGRLLVRYSGTEPKCRVMVEAADAATTTRLCQSVAAAVQAALGR
jgi:phosphoglucosamine mutase